MDLTETALHLEVRFFIAQVFAILRKNSGRCGVCFDANESRYDKHMI
ncbi:hypothetical protein BCAR13_890026 [Paraburkholderia caribensis]|nr:hypothetical protein BCAR13_890026 [Paraburkholderia caribensis]